MAQCYSVVTYEAQNYATEFSGLTQEHGEIIAKYNYYPLGDPRKTEAMREYVSFVKRVTPRLQALKDFANENKVGLLERGGDPFTLTKLVDDMAVTMAANIELMQGNEDLWAQQEKARMDQEQAEMDMLLNLLQLLLI